MAKEKKAIKSKKGASSSTKLRVAKPRSGNGLSVVKAFRIDDKTNDGLMAICDRAGYSPSEWMREAVLANETQVVARRKPSPDYKRLLFLANKASNNINQLAHRANADFQAGKVSEKTYEGVLLELHSLTRFFKGMLRDHSA